jgi:N-glycosylase/DNA lyase
LADYIKYHFIKRLYIYNVKLRYFKRRGLRVYNKKYHSFLHISRLYEKVIKAKKKKKEAAMQIVVKHVLAKTQKAINLMTL